RINDIHKVVTKTMLGYKVMDFNVKSIVNHRFNVLMSKMIDKRPGNQKIMTKRVKLENLGDADCEVPINETFHEQTDDELTKKELKHVEVDDQAIQTILLGLPKDISAAVDNCETAQEIWLHF
nr:ribonuclease H-like domain-containing protein [Tanacetum cinerariifolium]